MGRRGTYLLMSALCATVLAVVQAAVPRAARADGVTHLWTRNEYGEVCSGACAKGQNCCIVVAPAPPP